MFEEHGAAMYVVDLSTFAIIDANRAALSFYGYDLETMLTKRIPDLNTLPEAEIRAEIKRAIEEGRSYYVFKHQLASGEIRDVEVYANPILIQGKEYSFSIVHDITDLKRSEQALRKSEEMYRLLADNAEDVIFTLDLNLKYTYVSPSVKVLRGFEPSEVIGSHISETLAPESLLDVSQIIREELLLVEQEGASSKRSRRLELQMKRKDGSTVWTEVKGVFIRDAEGRPTGILGVTRDISERKQAEEALQNKTHELTERVKELNCLYGISQITERRDIALEDTLQSIVNLIPQSWQYLEIACARIRVDGEEYTASTFGEVVSTQSSQLIVQGRVCGSVEVGYLQEKRESDEGPFLIEERRLIDEIAERLGLIVERAKAEQALLQSEERYRIIVENAVDLIFRTDHQGICVLVNNAALRVLGFTEDEFVGRYILDSVAPEYREQIENLFHKQFVGKIPEIYMEFQAVTRSGGRVWLGQSTRLLMDGDRVVGFQGIARDITERKQAEEALAESQEQFALFMDMLPHGVFIKEQDGTVIYVNQYVKKLFDAQHWLGKNAFQAFPGNPELASTMHAAGQKALSDGQFTHEKSITDNEGEERVFQTTKFRIARANKPPLIGGIALDITELKQAKNKLRESEELYRRLVETAGEAIFVVDQSGKYVFANQQTAEMSGYSIEELLSMSPIKMIHREDRPNVADHVRKRTAGDSSPYSYSFRIVDKEGQVKWLQLNSVGIQWKGRMAALCLVADITEMKNTEEALRKSEDNYRSIFDTANDAIFVHDISDGLILDVNTRVLELYGFSSKDEIVGSHVGRLSSNREPFSQKQAKQYFEKARQGESQVFEWHARHKDGSLFWVEVSLKRVTVGGEERILAMVRDIEERKKAEQDLIENEKRYRAFFNTKIAAMAVFDTDTMRFMEANQTWLDMYGYTRDELSHLSPADVSAEPEATDAAVKSSTVSGDVHIPERRHKTKDGKEFIVQLSAGPFTWMGRNLMYCMMQDVTARRIAEKSLEESERKYKSLYEEAKRTEEVYHSLLNSTLDAIVTYDLEGRVTYVNNGFTRTFGWVKRAPRRSSLCSRLGARRNDASRHAGRS